MSVSKVTQQGKRYYKVLNETEEVVHISTRYRAMSGTSVRRVVDEKKGFFVSSDVTFMSTVTGSYLTDRVTTERVHFPVYSFSDYVVCVNTRN